MRIPDFFIIGAPKCGTTAIYSYLRDHPMVFLPKHKEPHFFCTDLFFPPRSAIRDSDSYHNLFVSTPPNALVGEASASYLYSEVAVERIVAINPTAKFIAILRNPVDMALSLHAQLLFNLNEDVPEFEIAWNLQKQRRSGDCLPIYCSEPKFLQYKEVCSFTRQITRLFEHVHATHRRVYIFEDFVNDPKSIYDNILDFLGLPSDGRNSFPRINERSTYRFSTLNRLVRRPPTPLAALYPGLKRTFNAVGIRPRRLAERWNRCQAQRRPLDGEFRARLEEEFADDVSHLEALLGRGLAEWRRSAVPA